MGEFAQLHLSFEERKKGWDGAHIVEMGRERERERQKHEAIINLEKREEESAIHLQKSLTDPTQTQKKAQKLLFPFTACPVLSFPFSSSQTIQIPQSSHPPKTLVRANPNPPASIHVS